jgi:excisionase family DNA binding protein
MTDEPFLTTDEVLEYLHVNLKTLYRLIKAGKIPAVRVGRQWRFRKRDIDAWLAAHATPAASAVAMTAPSSVLVVDDEEAVRQLIASALASEAGRDVAVAADGPSALTMLTARAFDLLITDLKMPGMDGLTLIRQARQLRPDLRVVIITGVPSEASAIDAINLGVSGYLPKPFRMPQILDIVSRALTA